MSIYLSDLFKTYKDKRKVFLGDRKKSSGSLKRLFDGSYDVFCHLDTEVNFYDDASKWLSNYLVDLSKDDITKLRFQLKSFKEKLNSHHSMLVISVLIIVSFAAFLGFTVATGTGKAEITYLVIVSCFSMFALFKRGSLIEHLSYCSQLDVLLESELSVNRG